VPSSFPSRFRSVRTSSLWGPALRYGVALASVAFVGVIIHQLRSFGVPDARPALLVAVAFAALYAGAGPGLAGLALAWLIAPDPVIGLAGAALVAICAGFRRVRLAAPPAPEKTGSTRDSGESAESEEQESTPGGFPVERTGAIPQFTEVTTEATWRFHHERPLDITLPEDEQVEHLYLYSVLAECNDAFARMYGFRSAPEVIGTRLVVFLPPSNPENVAYLRTFIRSGYRLEDAESHEIDRYGNSKYFINNLVGIFQRGELVGAWGTQRDITASKGGSGSQETRSRLHSTRSSSQ
jgi:PAS domain-containing protein